MTRLRLKPWYRVSIGDASVQLRYAGSVLELTGAAAARLLPRLLPLLDGTRTLDDLAAELGESARPGIANALEVLDSHGLLDDAPPPGLDPDLARTLEWLAASDAYGRGTLDAWRSLAGRRVAVVGSSQVASRVAELLGSVCALARCDWNEPEVHDVELVVVAPSSSEMQRLTEWNAAALEHESEWLQVLPFDGQLAAVGPIVVPHESACHECYRLRRSAAISPLADVAVGSYPSAPPVDSVLAGYAGLVALRRLAFGDGAAVGTVLALEQTPELSCSRHAVHRVPRCPACSPAARRAVPSPWSGVHRVAA
ncbi:MAG TPA: TOMM precursor leader peptide-binding protein [Gaiellaceae bacterium]|nr:TOMM precursor leader peptide-binding protein [Gaiellaceae bacterium]